LLEQAYEAKAQAKIYSLMNKTVTKFKFVVCPGNNSDIVRRCLRLREERWEETGSSDKLFNFKWQPFSRGIQFDMVN